MTKRLLALLMLTFLLTTVGTETRAQEAGWEAYLPPYERENLEKNRQWIASRRAHGENPQAKVGVFVDAGVWNLGATSLVNSLEASGVPCRVLGRDDLGQLNSLRALVLPGGFAGYQWSALGFAGGSKIRAFVEGGGHCLGVCAGSYLVSRTVRYRDIDYPYPIALFDGVAEGPVSGLPDYPSFGPVKVHTTPDGAARGLGTLNKRGAVYGGGPRFTGGSDVKVLLLYPDGTPAALRKSVGKGEVILSGVHVEVAMDAQGGLEPSSPKTSGALLRSLLGI